jgi:hypothetical protein
MMLGLDSSTKLIYDICSDHCMSRQLYARGLDLSFTRRCDYAAALD